MCIISQKYKCIFIHIPKNAGGSIRWEMTRIGGTKPKGLYQHVSSDTLRRTIPAQYKRFFSFAVVRNPWDRLWSLYKFALQRKGPGHPHIGNSFDDYLFNVQHVHNWGKTFPNPHLPVQHRPQTDWLLDEQGNIIVDFIGRFENITKDMGHVASVSNLPLLNLANHHSTSQSQHYTEAFSPEGIEFVRTHFASDIEMFNYEFGD